MIIADTSGLLAWFNSAEPSHEPAREVVETGEPLVISPYVVAELDYLVAARSGVDAELALLEELSSGAYELADFDAADIDAASAVIDTFRDQDIGLADASLVVLAARFDTKRILTLDHRHFGVLRALDGEHFDLLPG